MAEVINYKPPATIKAFVKDYRPGELFYDWIVGPVGSGKTTGLFFKLVYMAKLQAKWSDGIRRSRAVIVRNTAPQLNDTTLVSWNYWFKDGQAGKWEATKKNFTLRFDDVECEVLFRPLDTADDIARVLSLEVTFAIIDEFVQIPRAIVDALSARLGRYPSSKDGGATNWGMWGSSNPDTEDNWWFDFLHNDPSVRRYDPLGDEDAEAMRALMLPPETGGRIATYFHQPSGFSTNAENLENLPGIAAYYTNQAKGKSEAWVKQFVEAEWGFSIAGKPVVPQFNKTVRHIVPKLIYNPYLPLVGGFDPGLGGTALVFGQQDLSGRLNVLGEIVQSGIGTERFIREKVKPYLNRRFPEGKLIIAPDPAASNRTQTDEKTVVQVLQKHFDVKVESNNRFPLRLDAIDYFASTLIEGMPALMIDEQACQILIRALKGGWRYELNPKKDILKSAEPEKNPYSHVGDAFGYLCRYYHRLTERELRFKGIGSKAFTPPRSWGGGYHCQ